jgi:hypothetical protein
MEEHKYLTSKETKLILKIQDCDLAHIRNKGVLKFVKKRNAFMYSKKSVEDFKNLKNR